MFANYYFMRKAIGALLFVLCLAALFQACKKEDKIANINVFDIVLDINEDLYSVWFVDLNTGYCGGENGVLLKTDDGGKTWQNVFFADSTSMDITSIFFSNNDGLLQFTNSPLNQSEEETSKPFVDTFYLFTYNKGLSWVHSDSLSMSEELMFELLYQKFISTIPRSGSFYTSPGTGVEVIDEDGVNLNGKVNVYYNYSLYDQVSTGVKFPQYGVHMYDINNGYIVGHKSIIRTTNGGLAWEWLRNHQGIQVEKTLYGVYCESPELGYAVGKSGTLIKFRQ